MSDQTIVVPIPIRDDLIIRVHLPANLTKVEAEKVANVVKAMALPDGKCERS